MALVALKVIPPPAAVKTIDPSTLLLLFAMMIVSAHPHLAGFFDWIGRYLVSHTRSSRVMLAWLIAATGMLAALFLNDTVVIAFTPLVLSLTGRLKRNPGPYLVGLAVAANVGSTATITGNPQNIIIGQ